jgi:putative transposase
MFITGHKARYGVEPICRVLSEHGCKIAPSTYYDAIARGPSARAVRDEQLKIAISPVWRENYGVYGARKVWLALNREGVAGSLAVELRDIERSAGVRRTP